MAAVIEPRAMYSFKCILSAIPTSAVGQLIPQGREVSNAIRREDRLANLLAEVLVLLKSETPLEQTMKQRIRAALVARALL